MSNKITISCKFYKHLKEFMKDLIMVIPDDREIKVISSSINIASMDDEDYKLIYTFRDSLLPLDVMIINRDDNLFNVDFSKYWENDTQQYKLFSKLNSYWITMNEVNRKIIWDYLQLIYSLSKQM